MSHLDATVFVLGGAAVTFALDQGTKALVLPARTAVRSGTFVSLSLRRAAIVWLLAAVLLGLIVAIGPRLSVVALAGIALVVGGAAGNLVDRMVRGGVVDFIAVGRWPAFNVADSAMACGLCVAAVGLL